MGAADMEEGGSSGSEACNPRQFRHKAVRDLAWLLYAEPLLTTETGLDLLCESEKPSAVAATLAWLRGLDEAPAELLAELKAQPNVRRLGFYASALTEFWLRYGPNWGTKKILSSVPLTAPTEGGKQRTAGQLKFVCLQGEEILHVESSLKFFIDAAPAHSALAEAATMSRFVGPFLHENFAWRLAEAQRKLRCTQSKAVKAYLQAELGEAPLRSAYFLKGFIFRPLGDFRPAPLAWQTPPELNGGCPVGWYTSSLEDLGKALHPNARVAVLPKLFWLGPAEAHGDPPAVQGCVDLPGQEEAVPAEPWEAVEPKVREHFDRHDNALLLCELLPSEDGKWLEASRGFFLPPSWDPEALITEGPTGMRTSSECKPCHNGGGFADARSRFSDRFADTLRAAPPELAEAEIREGGMAGVEGCSELGREVQATDLVALVLQRQVQHRRKAQGEETLEGAPTEPAPPAAALRAALRAAESAAPGSACRLISAALLDLGNRGYPTHGHLVVELWQKRGNVPVPSIDEEAVAKLVEAALLGTLCPRLALRALARFAAAAPAVPESAAAEKLGAAVAAGDRHRLQGLVELLHASSSLQGELVEEQLASGLDLIAAAPADATVIDHIVGAVPKLAEPMFEKLRATGQHRLARRVGTAGTGAKRRPVAKKEDEEDDEEPLQLPGEVKVLLVDEPGVLDEALSRANEGGLVGLDAEWQPWGKGGARKVQLLQLAWPEVVFLLDLPALAEEPALPRLFERLLCSPQGPHVVGYGLEGDLKHVADSYPECFSEIGPWSGVELMRQSPRGQAEGLSKLCRGLLGRGLDKALQCSDWAQRPLSPAQRRYAALDAWVLLPLLRACLEAPGAPEAQGLRLQDAVVPEDAARAAISKHAAFCEEGAAAVAAALRSLNADRRRAFLSHTGSSGGCKTLACCRQGPDGEASGNRVLCVLPADAEANFAFLAAALGCDGPSSVRMATAEELRQHFRQPRGSVGPIGPAQLEGAAVVLDEILMREEGLLEFGGGSPGWQLFIGPGYLRELTGAVVAPVSTGSK